MKQHVTDIAKTMISEDGLINLSRSELCKRAKIPDGSFPHYMGCTFTQFVAALKKSHINTNSYPVVKSRANPELRREQILNVAVAMAKDLGYNKMTRDGIADRAGVSMGLVTNYFTTMVKLRRAVMRAAIQREIPEIIAQGLANGDKHAKKAPKNLKAQAAHIIAKS